MKFKKIVYIRYFPLNNAIYNDLYFQELLQNNISVDYLDLTFLFFPDKVTSEDFDFSGTIKINSYNELEDYLNNQNNQLTLYISIMTFEWSVVRLFRLFTKLNLIIGVFARGVFPTTTGQDSKAKIARIVRTFNLTRLKEFLGNKIIAFAKKMGYIKPYDYIFKAGEYGHWGLGIGSEIDCQRAEIVEINTVDYDRFLSHKGLPSKTEEEYIVFLDQYLPYHPDASYFKIKTVEPEPYFKEVNNFLDRIELLTGKKIYIAAHPKAELYKEFNPYNNRPLFFNQSNDLVKDAYLVLTHASTAVCFPICYRKRIILLVSDYFSEVLPHFLIIAKSIVRACGATLIAMDNEAEINIPEDVDLEKYNDFKYKYLTSHDSENQFSANIFINFINSTKVVSN